MLLMLDREYFTKHAAAFHTFLRAAPPIIFALPCSERSVASARNPSVCRSVRARLIVLSFYVMGAAG
jgi:hypothetical protein